MPFNSSLDFSTGEWSVNCGITGTNERRTGTLRAFLVPVGVVADPSALYSIRANLNAVDAVAPAQAQYPGLLALSPKRDWGTCPADCTASYADIAGVVPTVMIEPTA